ncbi:MAG TPA: glutathione S-transferase family protein [Candidatus Dormibacteraeota bacterium]|nr:glutathione S-transferase family protein [Candidatus Dormibacteraeota bacterium]
MPTVYGANASPFVRKVRVVLTEKNIPYELESVFPGPMAPPEFRQISPLGKIPAFRDGDRTLSDSSVICAYLERAHPTPALYPSDPYDYARALWFEEWADGGLVTVAGAKIFFQLIVGPRFLGRPTDHEVVRKAIDEELPTFFDYLEGQLGGDDFLVGNALSIGDIGVLSQFVNLSHAGITPDRSRWPKLAAYVEKGFARPSFKTLIEEEAPQFRS